MMDHPRQAVLFQSDNLGGKTMVLLLRMIMSDFSTGGYVTLDSGLCVLKGLIWLSKKVGFAFSFIKKRIYWPSMVPG